MTVLAFVRGAFVLALSVLDKFARTRAKWSSFSLSLTELGRRFGIVCFVRFARPRGASTLVFFTYTADVFRRGFEAAEFNDLLPQEVDCHYTIARNIPWTVKTALSRCAPSDSASAPERDSEVPRPALNLPLECLAVNTVCQPIRVCYPSRPSDPFFHSPIYTRSSPPVTLVAFTAIGTADTL